MTLLSIVGEDISRIIPLLYAYKEMITHHVLLCDDEPSNLRRAKTLQKGMQRFSSENSLGWFTQVITTDEDSPSHIEVVARKQFEYNGALWLNVTDGYPAMSILLSDFVRKEGGKVLSYDHFDNDLHTIDADGGMSTEKLDAKIDLQSYITLLNYKVMQETTREDLLPHKQHIMELFRNESLYHKTRAAILDNHFGHKHDFDFSFSVDILSSLASLGVLDKKNNLIPSMQKYLQGDILEEYIFWICESLNPDDIALGVKIDFDDEEGEPLDHRRVMNEFDILLTYNNRIYTIECKFSKELEGLEFVYKYDAIIDYFGKASKAIIANISPKMKENYIGMKMSNNFRHSTLRRARMSGISVYHESQINVTKFQDLVKTFFNMKALS